MPNFKPYADRAKEHGLSIKEALGSERTLHADHKGKLYCAFTSRGRVTEDMTVEEVFWYLVGFLQGKVGTSVL